MTIEFRESPDAVNGTYMVTFYCYNDKCPARTDKEPWPRSDGEYRSVRIISRNGKSYYRKRWVCKHCGEVMTGTVNASDFA